MTPEDNARSEGPGGRVGAPLGARVEAYWETEALAELVAYGRIPCLSPAFDPHWAATGAIDAAAAKLLAFARSRRLASLDARIVSLEGHTPLLLVEVGASDPAMADATTLLYGHLDKQPPLGSWREGLDPYEPVREGDLLYGRGMADDGYALFAALGAIEALEEEGIGHGRCLVAIEASEESGSPDLFDYVEHLAPKIGEPQLVLCLDSGGPSFDRLWVTSSLRGNLVATIEVAVLREGVHSGQAGGIVPSSFRILRQLLSRLEDEATGALLLPELNAPIPAHRRAEIAAVAAELGDAAAGSFPTLEGLELAGPQPAARVEAGTWGPSLALIGMDGIPSLAEGGNVLRASSTAKVSIRLPPTCDARRALGALEAAVLADPPSGAHVRFHAEAPAQGWEAPAAPSWLECVLEEASLAHFGASPRALGLGGSIPFMATLGQRYPDTAFLATGVLGPGSNAHGPNERLRISSARALTCAVADILAAVPPGPGDGH